MKRVYILHGWGDYHDKGWFPWLKKKLEENGFSANALEMKPQPPILKDWLNILKKAVKNPDKDIYFVGHSAGVMTILHYLQDLPENVSVGGVVMVAGWTDDLGMNELKNFFENPIDWNKVKAHCKNFVYVYSDNDPYVSTFNADVFKEKLGARLILEKGKKHFSFEEGISELPTVLNELLKIAK
ncbi:MAG: serine hydrolase family protein [Candidatus Woesearchaeota archaeon]|nr:MAG: serine hydrolase family protein [Candidatus Woesearchaeota archaeon]